MNTNFASSSHISSDDDDDDDDMEECERIIANFHQQNINLCEIAMSNNNFTLECLNNSNLEPMSGGSVVGHRMINRGREAADRNLFIDYFAEEPKYEEDMFRRRYRMSKNLFLKIVDAVENHDGYFVQRRDATGTLGLSTLQKTTAALRVLALGVTADAIDEYIKIGESTVVECVKRFCHAIVEVFSETYLRSPTADDVARLLQIGEKRGFPGMLGSIDCMHWKWKNCPTAWAGKYTGRSGSPTIILEAVADYELWIWQAYFGMLGSNNDINVLERSHLFSNLTRGISPPAHYFIQGKEYDTGYYLADDIYPKWSTLVQTIRDPRGRKNKLFAQKQEACRKDVERAFGVLQSRFAIVANPVRYFKSNDLHNIMKACIIKHNMIVEDERDPSAEFIVVPTPQAQPPNNENSTFHNFLARHRQIKDANAHYELQNALIEHIWEEYSSSEN